MSSSGLHTPGAQESGDEDPTWLHTHVHEPNPAPPSLDPTVLLTGPDGEGHALSPDALAVLPTQEVAECYIVSTGHGTSGPFTFGGVLLLDLLTAYIGPEPAWRFVDVESADGFGNRILADELHNPVPGRPILLALAIDGHPLTRAQGLVRLIVPTETDDALRQVKWVARITVH